MVLCVAVESRRSIEMVCLPCDSKSNQGLQDPIDSGSRDTGKSIFDLVEDLIYGRMIGVVQQYIHDDPSLHRQRDTLLPAKYFEAV